MATEGAMSSGSPGETKCNYDVFLSFTGKDTRHAFTGHLYNALCEKGINTFKDDDELRQGEQIAPALLEAIEESRISIIVFSENYAASTWCLDELVKILDCKEERNQLLWPIFYKVEPSDVRNQRNSYGKAMTVHENKFGIKSEKVLKWRSALSNVPNISGFHLKEGYDEYKFIKEIVDKAYTKVSAKELDADDPTVGLETRLEDVKSLLDVGSKTTTCMVGIHGTGGIGKTTLAKALYNSIYSQFEGTCFLPDVTETSNRYEGEKCLQQTLISEMLREKKIELTSIDEGIETIKRRLGRRRVLLVLDDVDDIKQLKNLARELTWFGSGSRIIITTRNQRLLNVLEVKKRYEMKVLNDRESLKLFCLNAFKSNSPKTDFEELSNRAIRYAKGLPLALKVIGSNLFGEDLDYWYSALNEYEENQHERIERILRISYERLANRNEKAIFLDIACFFKGQRLEYVKKILNACDFNAEAGIKNLIYKSLVNVEYGCLRMHDLLQDMGKEVVKQEAPNEVGKRSRLWIYTDIIKVLTEDTGSRKIQGIMLDPPQREEVKKSIATAFKKMTNLRILIVRNTSFSSGPDYLSDELRLLDWKGYPSQSFPPEFYPKNIVAFNLLGSPLVLENKFQKFEHLTYMNLSYCQSITQIPDVSGATNLRELRLDKCQKLVTVHESVGNLRNLLYLSASECAQLRSFLPRIYLPSLEYLSFNFCTRLEHFPDIVEKMDRPLKIYMADTAVKELPYSIDKLIGLEYLEMTGCIELQDLPISLFLLPNFVTLKIGGCSQLRESLIERFRGIHSVATDSSKLRTLHFNRAGLLDEDLHVIIHSFPELKDLNMSSSDNVVSLPAHIKESTSLTSLDVSYCVKLEEIPELPSSVHKVNARHCNSLTSYASIWAQVHHEIKRLEVVMPKTGIPDWFDHRDDDDEGRMPQFWVRHKFPVVALALVFDEVDAKFQGPLPVHWQAIGLHLFINGEHVHRKQNHNFIAAENHVLLCDLRVLFNDKEWEGLDALVGHDWKIVHVNCETNMTLRYWGVFVYEKEKIKKDIIKFTNPNLDSSRISMPASVPKESEEQRLKNEMENLNLEEIYQGTLFDFKALQQSENFKDMRNPS